MEKKKKVVCNLNNIIHYVISTCGIYLLLFTQCRSQFAKTLHADCYIVQSFQKSFNVSPAKVKATGICYLTAAGLAQLVERLTAE